MNETEARIEEPGLRSVLAHNPGPFTLEGTLTYLVGRRRVCVIDPGPDQPSHLSSVARAVADADAVVVLLTHGHQDHAGGAASLARLLDAPILGAGPVDDGLAEGQAVSTDVGDLVAVESRGHAREHIALHWRERSALFAGDLVLGLGDTTLVAGYPGCVSDYLASLGKLRAMGLRRIYPAHGPPIDDVEERLLRFEDHRRSRIAQVQDFLAVRPGSSPGEIVRHVYGEGVPPGLEGAALASVEAILDHLGEGGRS